MYINTCWIQAGIRSQVLLVEIVRLDPHGHDIGVTILFGRWQDMLPAHVEGQVLLDGIFFDTYGEYYEDLKYRSRLTPCAQS